MGHMVNYLVYDINTDKSEITNHANNMAMEEGDYHSGLNKPIRWIDVVCEDKQQAYEYIKSHDDGWYDQLAVKYRVYPTCEPTKALLNLKERLKKEEEKKKTYERAHSISSFKIEYIGCPNCGSKLKRTLIHGENCPLCRTELRSKTTIETIKRYEDNIKNIGKQIRDEERKINLKNIKKAKIKWLVKIEYHV